MRRLLFVFPLMFPLWAYADSVNLPGKYDKVEVFDDGRYMGIRGTRSASKNRSWRQVEGIFDRETSQYVITDRQDFDVQYRSTKYDFDATSSSKVRGTVYGGVSRPAVLSSAFSVAKSGARLASRALPVVGNALLLKEAYDIVSGDISAAGYEYDPSKDEFLKSWDNKLCLYHSEGKYPNEKYVDVDCIGVDSSTIRAYRLGGRDLQEAQYLMQGQMQKMAESYWSSRAKYLEDYSSIRWTKYSVHNCEFDLNGGSCTVINNGDVRNVINFSLKYQKFDDVLTAEKFLDIATGSIDSSPASFVEASGYPQYEEKLLVEAGQSVVVQDGDKGFTLTFGNQSDGVSILPLSDAGGQASATGAGQAAGKDGKTDSKTDSKKDEKKDEKTRTEVKPSDKNADENKDNQPQNGLLCEIFPSILACEKMGNPEEGMFDDITIPHVTDETTWNPDNFLPPNGVCPEPKTFHVAGRPVQLSYEPLCELMRQVRFAVLLGFTVMSAFIVFGSLRK